MLHSNLRLIADELNVKEVIIHENQNGDVVLDTTITEVLQKEGDMRRLVRAIQDARKEKGLQPTDMVILSVSSLALLSDVTQLKTVCKVSDINEDQSLTSNSVEFSSGILYFSIT